MSTARASVQVPDDNQMLERMSISEKNERNGDVTMRFLKLLLAAFMFFMLPLTIHAGSNIDISKKGTVTIVFDKDTEFHFYQIASVDESGNTHLYNQYRETDLDLQSPANWEKDASTIASIIRAHNAKMETNDGKLKKINDNFTIKTKKGSGTKKNVPVGVYLVIGDAVQVGNVIYYPTPFLVSMPSTGTDADNIEISYDVIVDPVKHTQKTVEMVYYKVVKHWDVIEEDRIPEYVEIAILHGDDMPDPEEVEGLDENPVVLDNSNNWTYTWGPVMRDTDEWSVWEFSSLPGFRTTIECSEKEDGDATEITFLVTNTNFYNPSVTPEDQTDTPTPTPTKTPEEDDEKTPTPKGSPSPSPGTHVPPGSTPPPSNPPRIPNTSDRNNVMWSIIGLCASGMIALISGIVILRNSE